MLVVADDDQSIYSFRASNPTYLLNFTKGKKK
ncbi:MAG: UvrD-helicase domain-containing protein [Anaerococcus obesiensis]